MLHDLLRALARSETVVELHNTLRGASQVGKGEFEWKQLQWRNMLVLKWSAARSYALCPSWRAAPSSLPTSTAAIILDSKMRVPRFTVRAPLPAAAKWRHGPNCNEKLRAGTWIFKNFSSLLLATWHAFANDFRKLHDHKVSSKTSMLCTRYDDPASRISQLLSAREQS